jgi:hypothetical protein
MCQAQRATQFHSPFEINTANNRFLRGGIGMPTCEVRDNEHDKTFEIVVCGELRQFRMRDPRLNVAVVKAAATNPC